MTAGIRDVANSASAARAGALPRVTSIGSTTSHRAPNTRISLRPISILRAVELGPSHAILPAESRSPDNVTGLPPVRGWGERARCREIVRAGKNLPECGRSSRTRLTTLGGHGGGDVVAVEVGQDV